MAITSVPTNAVSVDQNADDHALGARCRQGDPSAFEGIVRRYQRVLVTVAQRMLDDVDAANDATQNAFIKAYQSIGTYDSRRRFFSWLYRILVNECLDARRDVAQHEPLGAELAAAGTPADDFESAQRRRAVHAAIQRLPTEYRDVILLRHFTELSYEEIGETLGVSATMVKSRLHIARGRLAVNLKALARAKKIRPRVKDYRQSR